MTYQSLRPRISLRIEEVRRGYYHITDETNGNTIEMPQKSLGQYFQDMVDRRAFTRVNLRVIRGGRE